MNGAGLRREPCAADGDAVLTRDVYCGAPTCRGPRGRGEAERVSTSAAWPASTSRKPLHVVGPDGSVVGVDGSLEKCSRSAAAAAGRSNRRLQQGEATLCPWTPRASTPRYACRCSSTGSTRRSAPAQVHRALRPGGRVVARTSTGRTATGHPRIRRGWKRVLQALDEHLHAPSCRARCGAPSGRGFERSASRDTSYDHALDRGVRSGVVLPLIEQFVAGRPAWARGGEGVGRRAARAGERGELFFAGTQFASPRRDG